jgi:outer membrane protein assembly factor BamB
MLNMRITRYLLMLVSFAALPLLSIAADQRGGWRINGYYPNTQPAISWSPEKNVIWKTPLAESSNSLPVMLNGKLYIGAEKAKLICLDAKSGKILWQKSSSEDELLSPEQKAERAATIKRLKPFEAEKKKIDRELRKLRKAYKKDRKNKKLRKKMAAVRTQSKALAKKLAPLNDFMPKCHKVTGYSTPTPATDGKNIYVCYGTGMAAAYTPEGKRLWLKVTEKPTNVWGFSSSPVFAGGKFIISYKHITALDPQTGKEVWKRSSKYRWGSPVAVTIDGKDVILTPSGELIRAADGVLLSKSLPILKFNSPMVHKGIVYTFSKDKARAHRLPTKAEKGAKAELIWEVPIAEERYYASPATDGKIVYCIIRYGKLTALDAKTGKKLFERKINLGKGQNYPSPTIAGNTLFVSIDNGKTAVLKLDAAGTQIGENSLTEFRSCPIFIGDRMYLRTLDAIYCIGKK